MLVIRDEQIQAFLYSDEEEFGRLVSRAVRRACPVRTAGYSDEKLVAMSAIGIERARARGLTRIEDIAAFVAIMFEISPRFDEHPAISQVLEDARFKPSQKMELIFRVVPDKAWEEAETTYDENVWFPQG
jgi:hypothetical protein